MEARTGPDTEKLSTFKEDWESVLCTIIEADKGKTHLVGINDIFAYDTVSEFKRDSDGTLRPVLLRDTVRNQQQHKTVESVGRWSVEVPLTSDLIDCGGDLV